MRNHLAYLAARLMAEDGIQDYAAAKLKAARQAGVPDTHALPDNREIEAALRAYQALYQHTEQPDTVNALRRKAVHLMKLFAPFNPHLVGSVLAGTAGKFSDINLQLFCDGAKQLELFLIDQAIPYQLGLRRTRLGDRALDVPLFSFDFEGTRIALAVFDADDLRVVQKHKSDRRSVERARIAQVQALVDAPNEAASGQPSWQNK